MSIDEITRSELFAEIERLRNIRAALESEVAFLRNAQQANTSICPYYKVNDLAHVGDRLGLVECTCNGRPGKQQ